MGARGINLVSRGSSEGRVRIKRDQEGSREYQVRIEGDQVRIKRDQERIKRDQERIKGDQVRIKRDKKD